MSAEAPSPQMSDEQLQSEAARVAHSRLDDTGSVDPMSLITNKKAEIEQREAEEAQRAKEEARRAEEERAELERKAEEMAPTEEEIQEREAKQARMSEMERWANTTGVIAEEKAKKATENEKWLRESLEGAESLDTVDYATKQYGDRNKDISKEEVVPDHIPGTTDVKYRHSGSHNVIDEKNTTRSTVNGWDEFNRSPGNVRDDNLPHGSHNNPDVPTWR